MRPTREASLVPVSQPDGLPPTHCSASGCPQPPGEELLNSACLLPPPRSPPGVWTERILEASNSGASNSVILSEDGLESR